MTQLANEDYLGGIREERRPALFSPSGRLFLILTRRGNIADNTNVYALTLFRAGNASGQLVRELLTLFSSSSNNPGIRAVEWIDDRTVAFIGEKPGEVAQVYEVDCETKELTKLTNHATNVLSYAIVKNGSKVFFLAQPPVEPIFDRRSGRDAVIVSGEALPDLITGERRRYSDQIADLFMSERSTLGEALINTGNKLRPGRLWLSPNGQFLIATAGIQPVPEDWKDYGDRWRQSPARSIALHVEAEAASQYWLLDTHSETSKALLNSPLRDANSEILWSPDSNSVVVSGVYLPLNTASGSERELRKSTRVTAEIKIPTLEIKLVSPKTLHLEGWDSRGHALLVRMGAVLPTGEMRGVFQRTAQGWKESTSRGSLWEPTPRITVTLQEDMNSPPRLIIADRKTGARVASWDFNPQFKDLKFGHVRSVMFKAKDGHTVSGGVYLPRDYVGGRKYPLVIQTHAWNPRRFWIDGPWPSAFAAQPLASAQIIVLQMEETLPGASTPEEAPGEASAYEGAIDYLDDLGMIYRERVGIIGFSRTGLGVEYVLTHSKYHFSAATIADGSDGGYYFYLTVLPSFPWRWPDLEAINKGPPFGDGLSAWSKISPGFNLSIVDTPVRLESYQPMSLFFAWEWFAGLSRLGKPVELLYLPDADHVLVRPRDRLKSQQGNVDWFRFWLQDYEDPDPAKAEQYARWRDMKRMQSENDGDQR